MAVFSVNQNRHLYVAGAVGESITDASAVGTIVPKVTKNGVDKELFFLYKGANGEVLRSDLIQLKNLSCAKMVKAVDMRIPLKSVRVSLSPDINSGNPIVGQDYLLGIDFRQFYGMSERDQYYKSGVVHVTQAMAASPLLFYQAMVRSLNLNFSREVGATKNSNPYLSFAASAQGITITEKVQDWSRGIGSFQRVYFEVRPTFIYTQGEDVIWAAQNANTGKYYTDVTPTDKSTLVITGANATGVGNGKQIADLEWFCLGERGDQYRMAGWPNIIPTEYQVDPTKEYDALELHFAFTDEGVNSYRSEKDITIVAETGNVISGLVSAVEEVAGITVDKKKATNTPGGNG